MINAAGKMVIVRAIERIADGELWQRGIGVSGQGADDGLRGGPDLVLILGHAAGVGIVSKDV